MNGWNTKKIKDCAVVITKGTTPTTLGYEFTSEGVNFIKAESILRTGQVDPSTFSKIDTKTHEVLKRSQIQENDILVTIAGVYLGKIGLIRKKYLPANTNQAVAIVRPQQSILVPNYLKYFLLLPSTTIYINGLCPQSAQPNLNLKQLGNIEIPHPPLPIQRKIAAVLSAYDDLIENNNRRIAILEKMAEELYREWFVRLRFPGHENVKIVKGVPEGWEVKKLGEVAEYLNGYPFAPDEWQNEGLPIIKIKELKEGVTSQTPRNTGEKIPKKLFINNGDLLFSWSGSLEVVLWNGGKGLLNQHLFKVVPAKGISREFLFLCLKESIVLLSCLTTGATMQHIKRKELNHVEVYACTTELMSIFTSHVEPILREIEQLSVASDKMCSLRDRLLSRLMSGKLDVENLDIEFPPSMKEDLAN